ncbi:Hypothetical protein PHPALM_8227 [Phytophthora palmivora]|uniref:Pol protein n=1 Tax=Phytophthora palmivora TaxID=4796 RepID=A0A2P4YAC5_9STRA|nr:Hypothetical protein PHPALM_8227 [Phytophthora palmivora]
MATHPTFYVGRLKRYHDPLGLPSRTEEDQGENSPPRNEAELSGQPELPVSKPANDIQAGTHASHTKGMTVPNGKSLERLSLDGAPSRRQPELGGQHAHGALSLTTKSVQVLTKDLKGPRLASLRGSLIIRSKPKGYLDRIDAISKLTNLVA